MANPSLQIGNDNWAVKEDNLLGYSTAGTRFVPEPITMTRGSASTRVNPSGLVETVELLGSEEVTCGDFSCADPNAVWTKSANWTIANNLATSDGSQTGNVSLKQSNTLNNLTTGTTYKVQFTISGYVAGVINPHLRGVQSGNVTGDGIKTSYITAGSGSDGINLYAGSTFKGSISNVSVKESTRNDLARVDYDGSVSSLLAEPQRTNLIPYSEDFSKSAWTKTRCTIDSGGHTSPSGESNAFKMTATDDDARLQDGSEAAGVVYTQSIYVKSATGSDVSGQVDFTGTQIQTFTATSEWQRVDTTSDDTRAGVVRVRITNSGDELYIWGAQLEVGSYPTSYITTSGSTVTRNQETYEKTGISDKINSTEGVLFVEMAALSNDGTSRAIGISDGSSSDRVIVRYRPTSGQIQALVVSGSTTQALITKSSLTVTDFTKIAVKYKVNDFALWIDGVEVGTDTSGIVPVGMNELSFHSGSDTNALFAKVKQVQVYKTALSDDELTVLTGTSGVHFYPSYATMASGLTYKIE